MLLWHWDIVRPIRTYFNRRRRLRWKRNYTKGQCPSCKLPFDSGKKRCVVDSCGHDRCYSCLCVQDSCPTCIREVVTYRSSKKCSRNTEKAEKRKSSETPMRVLMNITNEPSLSVPKDSGPSGIYQKGQYAKGLPQPQRTTTATSFDEMFLSTPECFIKLKPLYFEVPQPENENAFLYRQWVFQEIYKAVSSNLRGVVLVGDEGSGKTTLILQLVDWSSFGRKRKSGIISESIASDLITFENLASKVVGYHFCQKDCSETCMIANFVHSLAAQLCQAPQLVEFRNVLLQDVSCQQVLSLENCIADPDTAFSKGILQPLRSIKNSSFTSELLVIDSIHEAENQQCSFTSFLASHIEEFPSWLKVVITIKKVDVNKLSSLPLHRINLNLSELKVQEDLFRYARCRITNNPVMQTNISSTGDSDQITRFVEHLVKNGQASFLFMRIVLDLFQQNYLVIKSNTFNVIPTSLDEVFMLNFNLKFSSMVAFNKVKPILEICLASQNPLTALEIFYTLESASVIPKLNWYEFTQNLHSLYGILIQRKDESLMISHSALRHWLINNKKFACDISLGHTYLALLPTRMCYPLTKEKEIEFVYHLSRCKILKEDKKLYSLWLMLSPIDILDAFANSRALFWVDSKILHLLLESNANPNSNMEATPIIHEICKLGSAELLTTFMQLTAATDYANEIGATPLIIAAERGHLKVIEILINNGSKVHLQDKVGRCALSCAAEKGYLDIVTFLLQPNNWVSLSQRSQAIQRALITASGAGRYEICNDLVKIYNDSNMTLNKLTTASSEGQKGLCRFFLSFSSASNADNLKLAAFLGHISTLQTLEDKDIDWNSKDEFRRSALAWACINNKTNAVQFLLEKKVAVSDRDYELSMPIHLAAKHGNADMVRLLLHNGSNPEIKDKENKTALECALTSNNFSTSVELIKANVKINDIAFDLIKEQPHLYSALLCKVFCEGEALYKEGKFVEAIRRLEYGLNKCSQEIYHNLQIRFDQHYRYAKELYVRVIRTE
ncbi:protein TANC2 isoform X1 [Parasteatoda tepidariorum]|uniref:protein TANC2 isoform X1 n=1 Tax=Parasteatoda tepidariorum TaxID=114398 RepID=UPI001C71A06D|nr:protein TANC2 [Parasteatoda tepidariorum]